MKNLLVGLVLLLIANCIIWLQSNLQFINKFWSDKTLLLSLLGVPVAYLMINSYRLLVKYFNGEVWPVKIVSSVSGTIIFSICTYLVFNEGFTTKTIICICLSLVIIFIQLFF